MNNNKVLYISQEITPYLPETPMSLLGRNLPQNIQERGFEARTFMPKYGCINERRNQLHEVIRLSGMNVIIDDTDHPLIIKVATLQSARMQVYFIDNDDYFQRSGTKGLETATAPDDNDERIMFFVRGVIETVKKLRWEPSVIHCSGWISALAPLYVKRIYNEDPSFRNGKVIYSIHDAAFEGTLDDRFVKKLKMDRFSDADLKTLGDSQVDITTLNKLAVDFADGLIQESENIDPQIVEYIKSSGKPYLEYVPDEEESARYDRYAEFYKSL